MFFHMTLEHPLVLHPRYFGPELKSVIVEKLYYDCEGHCSGKFGFVVAITSILEIKTGVLMPCDGFVLYNIKYNALVFRPFKGEVLDGVIKQITKVGIFAEIGPLTCFISHNSLPRGVEFDGSANPVVFKSQDKVEVYSVGSQIRTKIVGLRVDNFGIFAIGTLLDDYLGLLD